MSNRQAKHTYQPSTPYALISRELYRFFNTIKNIHLFSSMGFLVFWTSIHCLQAVSEPVKLRRACLDRTSSILTLSLEPAVDNCGSFRNHTVFGREDASSPWTKMAETTTLSISSISITLPNKKRWEFYISTFFSCTGKDSLISNHVFIDDKAPDQFEPDSVSVELQSQCMSAGWSIPKERDIKGYSLFKYDGVGNVLTGEVTETQHVFTASTFNTTIGGNKFAIAAFDSCLNGGLISNYHSPILLTLKQDANFWCTKKSTLTWSAYLGWKTEYYSVWRFDSSQNSWFLLGKVDPLATNNPAGPYVFIDSTFTVNSSVLYVIRAKKMGEKISSSSNAVKHRYTHQQNNPSTTHLYTVSVTNPNEIEIAGDWFLSGAGSVATLQKKTISTWFDLAKYTQQKPFSYFDYVTKTSNEIASYRLIRKNDCGLSDDSSCVHQNTLLLENNRTLTWNPYIGWNCINSSYTYDYTIERKIGSTWNMLYRTQNKEYTIPNDLYGPVLFRIVVKTITGDEFVAFSNELGVFLGYDKQKDTLLIPNAFKPNGANPVFRISNPAIGLGESTLFIYNRWGAKLFEGDALIGWNGHQDNSFSYPLSIPGIYVYRVIADYRNKYATKNGTLLLLE